MTDSNRWRIEANRQAMLLTPLNLATTARYIACLGQHVPSGRTVVRSFPVGDRELAVCANCDVPVVPRGVKYGGSVTVKALLEKGTR